MRLGWLVSKNTHYLEKIGEFKDYLSVTGAGPSEVLSIIALRNKKFLLERTMKIIESNIEVS